MNGRHLESLRLFIHKFPVLGEGEIDGTVASLFTTVPYSIARTDSILSDPTITIYLAIVAAAAILTLTASLGAARRVIRTPTVDVVAA